MYDVSQIIPRIGSHRNKHEAVLALLHLSLYPPLVERLHGYPAFGRRASAIYLMIMTCSKGRHCVIRYLDKALLCSANSAAPFGPLDVLYDASMLRQP